MTMTTTGMAAAAMAVVMGAAVTTGMAAAAMAAFTVPLANVLKAYGISDSAITLAFCTGGIAAFISPMIAGSLADRRVPAAPGVLPCHRHR